MDCEKRNRPRFHSRLSTSITSSSPISMPLLSDQRSQFLACTSILFEGAAGHNPGVSPHSQGRDIGGANKDSFDVVDRYLCSTVDQLNKGKEQMTQQETIELVMMNIKAAELSTSHCSWKSALVYIEHIAPLLSSNQAWEWRYDLCLQVNTMHAEINFNLGNYEKTESSVKMILQHGK